MTSNSDLRDRALRIIDLEATAKEAKEDVKAAYDAAASAGYTKAALRKAVKIYSMDADRRAKHESEQTDLELYLAEIEGRSMAEAAE
jgi:uncharacterized protein (UPF0335 family)